MCSSDQLLTVTDQGVIRHGFSIDSINIIYHIKCFVAPPPALDFDLDLEELEEYNPSKVLNFSNCDDGTSTSNVQIPDTQMETNDVHQIEQKSSAQKYPVQGKLLA